MKNSSASGVILYAKQPGITSFSSLSLIKKALGTGKVGHTGTLDSFAEGLLVVLVGKLTRLVPYVTAADKTYQAVVSFGKETDTLELTGNVVKDGPVPSREQVENVLCQFTGQIQQRPPLFSAMHIDGRRASDIARSGETVEMPFKTVVVGSIELLDYSQADGLGLFEVTCSKGTYIRSLARDIAIAAGSCAHLVALRRTYVGDFDLADAVFADGFEKFDLKSRGCAENPSFYTESQIQQVRSALKPFTPALAGKCGLVPLVLRKDYENDFFAGRSLKANWFLGGVESVGEYGVFAEDNSFAGVVRRHEHFLQYGFVVPKSKC